MAVSPLFSPRGSFSSEDSHILDKKLRHISTREKNATLTGRKATKKFSGSGLVSELFKKLAPASFSRTSVKAESNKEKRLSIPDIGLDGDESVCRESESPKFAAYRKDALKNTITRVLNEAKQELNTEDLMGVKDIVHLKKEIHGRPFQINIYPKDSYNGPKTQDFLVRQKLIYSAAKHYVNNFEASADKEVLKDRLKKLKDHYKEVLSKHSVDENVMKGNAADAEAHYLALNAAASQDLAQYAKDAVEVINTTLPLKRRQKCSINKLIESEKQCVLARGRPTIVNFYAIEDKQFVSMQEPGALAGPVVPSTIRNREGLCNYVTTTFAECSGGEVNVLLDATRHANYPPITIKNFRKRRAIALENCKQGIIDDARRLCEGKELKPGEEIVVPTRVMMLLTPKRFDFFRNRRYWFFGPWKGESETTQLKDCAYALEKCRRLKIQAEIDGVKVTIVPDISFMNLGTNAAAAGFKLGKLPNSPIQKSVNARGFEEFFQESFLFLEEKFKNTNEDEEKLYAEYCQALNARESIQKNLSRLEKLKARHKKKCAECECLREAGHKAKKHERAIARLNTRMAKAYVAIDRARAKNYKKNHEAIIGAETKLVELLQSGGDPLLLDFFRNHREAIGLYLTRQYSQKESVNAFQVLYLQQQQAMGNLIKFFCKSAEDRTGRVNNILEEREAFRFIHGQYPEGEERVTVDELIAFLVTQYSASVQNTSENSNAPGLQISEKVNPPSILPQSQRGGAKLAKIVYRKAKGLSISDFASTLLKEAS